MGDKANLQKSIGARLRSAREALNYSQADVADLLGLSTTAYGHIETGRNALAVDHLVNLVLILKQPPGYFLGLSDTAGLEADEARLLEAYRRLPLGRARSYAIEQLELWLKASQ